MNLMWANLYYLNYRTGVGMAFVLWARFFMDMHNRNFSLSRSHDITQFFLSFFLPSTFMLKQPYDKFLLITL